MHEHYGGMPSLVLVVVLSLAFGGCATSSETTSGPSSTSSSNAVMTTVPATTTTVAGSWFDSERDALGDWARDYSKLSIEVGRISSVGPDQFSSYQPVKEIASSLAQDSALLAVTIMDLLPAAGRDSAEAEVFAATLQTFSSDLRVLAACLDVDLCLDALETVVVSFQAVQPSFVAFSNSLDN